MYINFWYAMEMSEKVTREKPHRVRALGQNFVLFRDEFGRAHCLNDVCTHRGGSMSRGRVKGNCVECPYHGWQFTGEGECVKIPSLGADSQQIAARTRLDAYPVEECYGLIFAFLGDLPEEERPPLMVPHQNPSGMEYPEDVWRWVTMTWDIKTNYERCVENGLDPAHNEFVHARHGFMGQRDDYKVNHYDLETHPWGAGFMHDFFAPPSTDQVLHKADVVRDQEGQLRAGAGHNGPNQVWTYIHITEENRVHQYLYETPVDEFTTRAFNIQLVNFLPREYATDQELIDMAVVIAEDDVVVLEELQPMVTPDHTGDEVMTPSDKSVIQYRRFLKEWDQRGWRIDTAAIAAARGRRVFSVPAPGMARVKNRVFQPMPLISPET